MTDITKIRIAAIDEASEVLGKITSQANSMYATFAKFAGFIGVGIGAGYFAHLIQGAIEAEANLYKLSKTTGMTVESLSSFMPAAKLSGTGMDEVAAASVKLSKAMVESQNQNSKQAMAFKALGVEALDAAGKLKSPQQMMLEVAKALAGFEDGAGKATAAQILMGKAGAQLLPFLSELANQGTLQVKVTTAQALAAKEYEDQIKKLQTSTTNLVRDMANFLLPSMNAILKAFIDGKREAGLWQGAIDALSETFNQVFGKSAKQQLADINEQIRLARESAQRAAEGRAAGDPDWMHIGDIENAAKLNGFLNQQLGLEHAIFEQELAAQDARATRGQKPKSLDLDLREAKAGVDEVGALLDRLQAKWEGFAPSFANDFALLSNAFMDGRLGIERFTVGMAQLGAEQPGVAKNLAELTKWEDEYGKALDRAYESQKRMTQSSEEQNRQLDQQIATFGMVGGAADRYTAGQLRALAAILETIPNGTVLADVYLQIAANLDLAAGKQDQLKALQEQQAAWTQLGSFVGDFFTNLVTHGGSAIDKLRQLFKQLFADLIKIFAQKWILQLAAAATGSSAAGAAASSAGSSAAGSLVGSAASAAFSWMGGATGITAAAGQFTTGWGIGSAYAAGTIESMEFAATSAMSLGAEAATAYAGLMETLAAIPIWGWIAAAVVAVVAWIAGSHKGGPKIGGSFMGSFSGSDLLGNFAVPGSDNGRFYTPNQGDSQIGDMVKATATQYSGMVGRLGGSAGKFGFGLGFDEDPQGTAQSRISAMVVDAANNPILNILNKSMDDKEVPAALALAMKQSVLVALQHSEFLDAFKPVKDLLNSIGDVASATSEQIDALLKQAMELHDVIVGLQGLNSGRFALNMSLDTLKAFAVQGETLTQTLQRVGGAWVQLVDKFSSPETKLAQSTRDLGRLYESLRSFGYEVPTTREGWLDVMRSLKTTDDAGKDLFAQMLSLADSFDAVKAAGEAADQTFDQLMRRLIPSYGPTHDASDLTASMALLAGGKKWGWLGAMTPDELVTFLGAHPAVFGELDQTTKDLINHILGLIDATKGNTTATNTNTAAIQSGPSASGMSPAEIAFQQYYQTTAARRSLGSFLSGIDTNPQTSTLDPQSQLGQAQEILWRDRQLGNQGDMNAFGRLQSDAQLVIQLARSMFGSGSGYVGTVDWVKQILGPLAQNADGTDYMKAAYTESQKQSGILGDIKGLTVDVKALLARIADQAPQHAAAVADATQASGEQVAAAVKNATIPTERL